VNQRVQGPAGPPLPLAKDTGDVDEFWFDYFKKRKPSPNEIAKSVSELHRRKRYDHVIALINAALIHGQSQPWMYDVLAMSMKLDKRPAEDIERAMMSRVDSSATDVTSLLFAAAFLVRLEGPEQALHLYRQASRIDPTRPEPYLLGLKIAQKLKDYESIQWAVIGTLTHAWTKDRKQRHLAAKDAAVDAQKALVTAGRIKDSEKFKAAVADANRRDLVLRLEWAGDGDLDLEIEEPLGTKCSLNNPISAGGGVYIRDGYGPKRENCYEEYVCVKGLSGDYRAKIHLTSGNVVGKTCRLTIVRYLGSAEEITRKLDVPLDKTTKTVRLTLHEGRRKALGPGQTHERSPTGQRMTRQQVLASVRRGGVAKAPPKAGNYGHMPAGAFTGAIGFQPIIGIIPEGISLTTTAVVSADRRYVRINVNPQFNTLIDLFTFSFQGGGGGNQGGGNQGGGNQGGGNQGGGPGNQ
jgi:hypothetical protein